MGHTSKPCEDIEQTVPLKEEEVERKLTNYEKLKLFKDNITIEPPASFFMVASVIVMIGLQNLNLDKACRANLKFDDSVCTSLTLRQRENLTYEEDEVQKLVASVEAWKSSIYTIFPMIIMTFLGAWSDKMGKRKICILMPIAGELITCVLNMINTYFDKVPVEWTTFMGTFFLSITGAWYTMFLGSFSYLSDATSKQERTLRIGMLTLCFNIAFPVGMGISGIILRYTGYYGVFGISGAIQLLNFLYVYFYIKDYLPEKKIKNKSLYDTYVKEFFNFDSLKELLSILIKKGRNNQRMRICLILTAVCLIYGPIWGDISVNYILCRYRFNWDELKYSIYSSYSLTLHTLGTVFSILLFAKKLKYDDSVIGVIAMSSRITGALVWLFARNSLEIYLAPIAELLNGTMIIALRAISSKLVCSEQLGKLFSLFGLCEILMMLIFVPIYSQVYQATLHILPGACFLIVISLSIPALFIFLWFYKEYKGDLRKAREELAAKNTVKFI